MDIMCEVNPEHTMNVVYENGRKVLYMAVLKAIYGCIESALRWYELYSQTLEKEGFEINQYDRCVANKVINGQQCTIVWYVDDNKLSHKDPTVVTKVLEIMKDHFGDLVIHRGKIGEKFDYLGMEITIEKDKKIKIEMKDQLNEAIDFFESWEGTKVTEEVTSPAQKHLRTVDDKCLKLFGKKRELFHTIVAKLLYIMKRARPVE